MMKPILIVTGLFILMLIASASAADGQGWKFQSDLSNSGVYDDGGMKPEGVLLWNYSTGDEVYSSPAVADGVVYVGSDDHTIYAFDASTGALLWNATTGQAVRSSPAVANGVVYVGSDDYTVYAFDAGTGAPLWNYTNGVAVVRSSPAVADGIVYIGDSPSKLSALDASTGALLWNATMAPPPWTVTYVTSSPAVAGGIVYVGSYDQNVYAFDALTGDLVWNTTTGNYVFSSPAVEEGVVYAGSWDNNLYALDADTGAILWNFTTGNAITSSPAVENGVVYFGSLDNNTYALDGTTGALLWNYTTGGGVVSSPAVANGVVYVGSYDHTLSALDAETGDLLWDYTTTDRVTSSPAVANGVVYFGCNDGNVYALGSFPENPPESVTSLHTTTTQSNTITWNWTDPAPAGFSHVMVYLDGVFQENVTKGTEACTSTGLASATEYTLGTRTVGTGGLVNETWVNHTAWTASESQATAWKFRADLANSGVYDDGGIRPGNELLWKYMTESYYGSSPAVLDGVLYICGIYDINAIDAFTGKLLWTSPRGGGMSGPAVADGVVYVGSSDKNVYALDSSDGDILWQYTTGGIVYSSPAVYNGVVYAGSWDQNFYALDASTGALLWNYTTGGEVKSSPAVADGIVYFGSRDHRLHALNAHTGALIWNYTTSGEMLASSPAVANGVVYIHSGDTLHALDALEGTLVWSHPVRGSGDSSPAVAGGVVYIGSVDHNLYAFEASTGDLLWTYTAGGLVRSSPSVANGIVYFGCGDGTITSLEAGTGDLIWTYTTDEPEFSSPAIANGVVYAQGYNGYLYALATLPDNPPASVTDLHVTTINGAEIAWAWTDPATLGFSHVMVYLDGAFQENVSAGGETWTATGLAPSTVHTIGIRTVGKKGVINATLVTDTATTGTLSISSLNPASVVEDSSAFTLDVQGTGFSPSCTILWNGVEQATQYLQPDHLSMEVPAEYVAHSQRVTITVQASGESSNSGILPVTDNPATAMARKFRSDLNNSGVYDDGGRRPVPTLLWTYTTGLTVSSSPSVVDGTVYIGSLDRNLYALDATTGALLWKYDTGERNDFVSSSPAVANGVVYIGGLKYKIHALDAYSGELLWNYKLPIRTTMRSSVSSSATVADGVVFIGNMDGTLYAFSEETGDLLWNHAFTPSPYDEHRILSSPAVAGGVVYINTYGGGLSALDASTGAVLWNYRAEGENGAYSSPAVADGVVYVGSGYTNKKLYAVDALTGDLIWDFTTGGSVSSSPAVANGVLFFGSNDNTTYALDATTGDHLWNFTTGGRVISSPAVANGVVYFGSYDNTTYALDASTGALIWSYATGGRVTSSPAVANGIVYFGCGDGNVYALGTLPLDPPVAAFTSDVTSGDAPLEVIFSDTSTGVVTTRSWDFGDGTTAWANETLTISHTYPFPGTFTVSLTAGNIDGQDTEMKTGYIQVNPSGTPPRAWFTASPMMGHGPLTVRFTDRSMGTPIGWEWDFGDGNTSSERNPGHTYATTGKYTPTLTVFNSGGRSSYSSSVWVREAVVVPTLTPRPTFSPEPGRAPIAMFFASKSFGLAPTTVQFTDRSLGGPTAWSWDFGDGNTSVLRNPANTFVNPGMYPVSLTVTNAYGESTTLRRVYVR